MRHVFEIYAPNILGVEQHRVVDWAKHPGPVKRSMFEPFLENRNWIVWAIGNQKLKNHMNIPGVREIANFMGYHKDHLIKQERMRALTQIFPEGTFVALDTADWQVNGWTHIRPKEFCENPLRIMGDK